MEAQTKMRLPREIQAAHDRIVAILIGEVNHDHNRAFAENLDKIDEFFNLQGIKPIKAERLRQHFAFRGP